MAGFRRAGHIYAQCFMVSGTAQEDWCRACCTLDHTTSSCPCSLHPSIGTKGKRAVYLKGPRAVKIDYCPLAAMI